MHIYVKMSAFLCKLTKSETNNCALIGIHCRLTMNNIRAIIHTSKQTRQAGKKRR